MTTKVLFALTSHGTLGGTGRETGYYVPEVAHPAAVFSDAGYDVEYVSVQGGKPPRTGIDPADAVVTRFLAEPATAVALATTPTPEEVDPADYDAIFLAGGHGTMWDFPDAQGLTGLAARIYEHGGVVAAVCHGPAGLVNLTLSDGSYLVDGKQVSAFTEEEEDAVGLTDVVPFPLEGTLAARGARIVKAPAFQAHAVADGRLVTGQNPASAAKVAELTVRALAERRRH